MKRIGDVIQFPSVGQPVPHRPEAVQFFQMRSGVPLWIREADLNESGVCEMTNWEGRRAIVFPLCKIEGEWVYPPVHLPPGEDRRAAEAAINDRYDLWLKRKKAMHERGERTADRSGW